jgi:MFS family permease
VLALLGGTLGTLSFPAFQGMLAGTVPEDDLESAVAINSLSLQLARFVGPAVAGVLLAAAGPTWVFGVNALSFLAVLGALAVTPSVRMRAVDAAGKFRGAIGDGVRYVFGNKSLSSLMLLMVLAGMFGTPPVAFMVPAIATKQLDGGAGAVGTLMALIGLGSFLGSIALLRLASRANKGEPMLAGYFATGVAIAIFGLSSWLPISCVVAVLGGIGGVVFIGLSTVVVQATASDAMRARAMAIWAAAFVGMLPFGALITGGLTALLGPGDAVLIDGLVVVLGGAAVLVWRPQVAWLGCAALPEACIAAVQPDAIGVQTLAQEPAG